MKRLFTLFFLFQFFSSYSANDTLTRAQVYNFNVGDTFDYEDCQINVLGNTTYVLPCTFSRKIITGIHYTADSDTLVITSVWPISYGNPVADIDSLNSVEVYIDADTSCGPGYGFYDSSQYNGRYVNIIYNYCLEDWQQVNFAEGLGVVFSYAGGGDPLGGDGETDSLMLIYYSKGTEKWGTPYYDFLTGINEPPDIAAIHIYPNPTNNIFFIEAGEPITQVEITDVSGRVVQTQTGAKSKMELNAANLSKGIYFCKVYFVQGFTTKKLVVN